MADEALDGPDIFYVCEKALEEVKKKVKDGEVTEADINNITGMDAADEEIMIPVDMRGVEGEFRDVEELTEKLGHKGTAEAFIKAREYFQANKDNEPEAERAQNMTAKEWKEVLEEDGGLEDMEEELFEGEEEEDLGDEDEGDEEPAAKKAKTD